MSFPKSLCAIAVASGLAFACGSTKTGAAPVGPEKACLDTIEALSRAAARCGQDYQTFYDSTVQGAAGGDCKKVISIRDEGALRGVCIPSLTTVPCPELFASRVDSSCGKQLQRPASLEPQVSAASFVPSIADVIE